MDKLFARGQNVLYNAKYYGYSALHNANLHSLVHVKCPVYKKWNKNKNKHKQTNQKKKKKRPLFSWNFHTVFGEQIPNF